MKQLIVVKYSPESYFYWSAAATPPDTAAVAAIFHVRVSKNPKILRDRDQLRPSTTNYCLEPVWDFFLVFSTNPPLLPTTRTRLKECDFKS